jgi:hypothetical protein
LTLGVMVGIVASMAGGLFTDGAASAGPTSLSTVVLSASLPGFVANPTGPTNGPINQSNLKYFGTTAADRSEIASQIADGNMRGYIRTWVREPLNGDVVIITAIWFDQPAQLGAFIEGATAGAQQQGGVAFAVPGISGASGYSLSTTSTPEFIVTFRKGNTAFEVAAVSGGHDLTSADAISVAARQAADISGAARAPRAPAPGSGSVTDDAGEGVGGVLVTALLVIGVIAVLRRRRSRRASVSHEPPEKATEISQVTSATSPFPVPTPPVHTPPLQEPGWHPVESDPNEQSYWDGQSWTARVHWDGATWVDVPRAPSPPPDSGPDGARTVTPSRSV